MSPYQRLKEIVSRLRAPDGCPWDREQTHTSLRANLIEESYEVLEAIDQGNPKALQEELGDLLLQVFLHAEIASEQNNFTIDDVLEQLSDKLVRRHPHVFSDVKADTTAEVLRNWDQIKRQEKTVTVLNPFADLPVTLSSLFRAYKSGKKAAKLHFDWQNSKEVLRKIHEEMQELEQAASHDNEEEEFGDLLFALAQWARHRQIDPETALHMANRKFEARFLRMLEIQQGKLPNRPLDQTLDSFSRLSDAEKDLLWEEAKKSLRS